MDVEGSELLVCPHCDFTHDYTVEEAKSREDEGYEGAEEMQCEECNESFIIVKVGPDTYVVEEIEDDEMDYEMEED